MNRLVTQQAGGLLRVEGTVNEPSTVRVDGRPATVDANGLFVGAVKAAPGTTRFTVTASDGSGNTASREYDVDQSGASKAFTFDANGNLTSDGTRTFEWDARNQVISMTEGMLRTDYNYDGLQQRVRVVERAAGVVQSDAKIVWCDEYVCEERATDGVVVTNRLFGQGYLVAGSVQLVTADHLGSLAEVTNQSGIIAARYSYDPWGRRSVDIGTDATSIGYTGHRRFGSQFWVAKHRAYDPQLARWIRGCPVGC